VPSNQMDINIEIGTSQSDAQAIAKLTEALKAAGGTGGGGGGISKQFGTAAEGVSYLKENQAAQEVIGGKLAGASIRAEAGGGVTASAKVDDGQKKAFSPGGAIGAMATGVGVAVGIFKSLLGMSKIFQTFMGTTGKILGTAVDLMLAPLMPFFMRIMVWLIQKIFPLATTVGTWLGGLGVGGAGAALVGGYVALKLGPTLLSKAGESLGKALIEKMPFDTFGENITYGLLNAKDTLKQWGASAGGFIKDGLIAAKDAMKTAFEAVGGFIQEGFKKAIDAATTLFKGIGTYVQEGFKTAIDAATTLFKGIGTFVQEGFKTAIDAASTLFKGIGTFVQEGFKTAIDAATTLFKGIGTYVQEGFKTGIDAATTLFKGIGTYVQEGFKTAIEAATTLFKGIGTYVQEGFKTGIEAATTLFKGIGTYVQEGFKTAIEAASTLFKGIGTFVQEGFKTGIEAASTLFKGIGSLISDGATFALEGATTVWNNVGGLIGKGIEVATDAWSAAGKAIGDAIGVAMKGARNLWSGLGSIGGLIGIGIGAAAIGGTIGYMIWKKYDEYQKGKDITTGLSPTQTVEMLQERFGIDETAGVMVQERMASTVVDEKVSANIDMMSMFLGKADEVTKGLRLFGKIDYEMIEEMTRPQQKLFADMIEAGVYEAGEKGFGELINVLSTQKKPFEFEDERPGTYFTPLKTASIIAYEEKLVTDLGERTKSIEKELESNWWAWNLPGPDWLQAYGFGLGHMNVKDFKGGGASSAERIAESQEGAMRKFWGETLETGTWDVSKWGSRGPWRGKYEGEMTPEMIKVAAWVLTARGEAPTSYFSPEMADRVTGQMYKRENLQNLSYDSLMNVNITVSTDTLGTLTLEELANVRRLIADALTEGTVHAD